jgi:hypothetical protein
MRQVAGRGRKRHLSLQGTVPDRATSAQVWYCTKKDTIHPRPIRWLAGGSSRLDVVDVALSSAF